MEYREQVDAADDVMALSDGSRSLLMLIDTDGGRTELPWTTSPSKRYPMGITDPALSPDATMIAFSSTDAKTGSVIVAALDGTEVIRVDETGASYDPAWSPDGAWLVVSHRGADDQSEFRAYRLADPADVVTIETPDGDGVSPSFSPDGTRLAYSTRNTIEVLDLRSGERTVVAELEEYFIGPSAEWSPVEDMLLYRCGGEDNSWTIRDQLCVVPADGGATPKSITPANAFDTYFAWSPDGTQVVVRGFVGPEGVALDREAASTDLEAMSVFVIDAAGGGRVPLVGDPGRVEEVDW